MFFTKTFVALSVAAAAASAKMVARDVPSDTLSAHNAARAEYGANALTWNDGLSGDTANWANACQFQHSGGDYGENLYASTGSGGNPIQDAVDSWMSEASNYDYNNPVFSDSTGHFTQVVWKSTTTVACAIGQCGAGTIFPDAASQYVVCRYSPPGNYAGEFDANVGRHV